MTLSSRLALAMVFLAVVAACVVGAFTWYFLAAAPQGVAGGIGHAMLAGGAVAVLLALGLAARFAQSLSGPLLRITAAAEAFGRGEVTPMPTQGVGEITKLATAFAGMAARLRTRQALFEHTVQSISDPLLVIDANGKIVIANAAARRLMGVDLSITTRSNPFRYFLADGVTRALPEDLP